MSRTTTKIVIAQKDGTVVGQYYLGQGEHVIGREIDSAVYISDDNISRQHARLIISEDIIEIEDLGSTSQPEPAISALHHRSGHPSPFWQVHRDPSRKSTCRLAGRSARATR